MLFLQMHGRTRVRWALAQHADGVAEILDQLVEDRHVALRAVLFLGLLHAAERHEGPPARFVRRHARAAVVLNRRPG